MKYVLYHKGCADGFGAAYAAWTQLRYGATYIPVAYGDPMPAMPDATEVYILDFSYPRRELVELSERVERLRVLDHHETAEKELIGLDFALFDNSKSGCVLAWEYFNPEREVPELLLYVQDRDLWRWSLPDSKNVNTAVASWLPWRMESWRDAISVWETSTRERMVEYGEHANHHRDYAVSRACASARPVEIDGLKGLGVSSCVYQSEIGHQLLTEHADADFAAVYQVRPDGELLVSLRGRGDVNVGQMAKKYGGGGHRDAAGFRWPSGLENLGVPTMSHAHLIAEDTETLTRDAQ